MTKSFFDNPTKELTPTIELLRDLHEALEVNSYLEEAAVVSSHIEKLQQPQTESRILISGINPIMEELAESFKAPA